MISMHKRMRTEVGLSLIEALLVLTIGVVIVLLGVRQYQSYQLDAEIKEVQSNVDTLFHAMAGFYQANCGGSMLGTPPTPRGGKLFIAAVSNAATSSPPPYPIDLNEDLIQAGFLQDPLLFSGLVDTSKPGEDYVLQFNEYPEIKYVNGNTSAQMGTRIIWKMQVAVLVNRTDLIEEYRAMLNATCISDLAPSTDPDSTPMVSPCGQNSSGGSYLVFERLPSAGSSKSLSNLFILNSQLSLFKLMYSTPPATYLTSTSHNPEYQYYNCVN